MCGIPIYTFHVQNSLASGTKNKWEKLSTVYLHIIKLFMKMNVLCTYVCIELPAVNNVEERFSVICVNIAHII